MSRNDKQTKAIISIMFAYQKAHKIMDECFTNSLVATKWIRKMGGYPNARVKAVIGYITKPYIEGDKEAGMIASVVVHMITSLEDGEGSFIEASRQYKEGVHYFDNWKDLEKATQISKQQEKFAVPTDEEIGEGRNRERVTLPPSNKAALSEFILYKKWEKEMNEMFDELPLNLVIPFYYENLIVEERKDYTLRLEAFMLRVMRNQEEIVDKGIDIGDSAKEM